jgi:hypothetical protein
MAGLLLSRLAGGAFTSNTRIRNTPVIAIICLFSLCVDEYAQHHVGFAKAAEVAETENQPTQARDPKQRPKGPRIIVDRNRLSANLPWPPGKRRKKSPALAGLKS